MHATAHWQRNAKPKAGGGAAGGEAARPRTLPWGLVAGDAVNLFRRGQSTAARATAERAAPGVRLTNRNRRANPAIN